VNESGFARDNLSWAFLLEKDYSHSLGSAAPPFFSYGYFAISTWNAASSTV